MQLHNAQLNYPVHEKELLAIVRTLKKWRIELLGTPFTVYTDHRTLENFMSQWELSCRQVRWQEFFGQYNFTIEYIPGEENTVANAFLRLPCDTEDVPTNAHETVNMPADLHVDIKAVSLVMSVTPDASLLKDIKSGYKTDPWCVKLTNLISSLPELQDHDGLLYINDRLVIPRVAHLRETIFKLAHNDLGHFGLEKFYAVLVTSSKYEPLFIP